MYQSTRTFAVMALAGAMATAGASGAGAATVSPLGTPAAGALEPSSLRCHLDLPVRVRGHRFVTSYDGGRISCAGMLIGRPVVDGALPHATGAAKLPHAVQKLPPAIGKTQLSLQAVGPALPFDRPDRTPIKLTLEPEPASVNGAGHFTSRASIRGREHQVAATIVFQPATGAWRRRCCITGRLLIDLTAGATRDHAGQI